MKKVLITGGSGWLAQFVYAKLKEGKASLDVHMTYNSRAPSIEWIDTIHTQKLDLADEAAVSSFIEAFQPDVVIHLAALSSPGVCEKVLIYLQSTIQIKQIHSLSL